VPSATCSGSGDAQRLTQIARELEADGSDDGATGARLVSGIAAMPLQGSGGVPLLRLKALRRFQLDQRPRLAHSCTNPAGHRPFTLPQAETEPLPRLRQCGDGRVLGQRPGSDETAKGEGSAVQLIIAGAVLSLGESFPTHAVARPGRRCYLLSIPYSC